MSFGHLRRRGHTVATIETQGPHTERNETEDNVDHSIIERVLSAIGATERDVIDEQLDEDGSNWVIRVQRVFDVASKVRSVVSGAQAYTVPNDARPSSAYTEIVIPATYSRSRLVSFPVRVVFLLMLVLIACSLVYIGVRTYGYQSPVDVVWRHVSNAISGQ